MNNRARNRDVHFTLTKSYVCILYFGLLCCFDNGKYTEITRGVHHINIFDSVIFDILTLYERLVLKLKDVF